MHVIDVRIIKWWKISKFTEGNFSAFIPNDIVWKSSKQVSFLRIGPEGFLSQNLKRWTWFSVYELITFKIAALARF